MGVESFRSKKSIRNTFSDDVDYTCVCRDVYTQNTTWRPLPVVFEHEQIMVGLHAVYPDANLVALTAAGRYTVDWGDGSIIDYNSGAQAEHEYDFNTFDPSGQTLSNRGYKQAIIKVYPQAGQTLTKLDLQCRHSRTTAPYTSGFLSLAISGPSLRTLAIGSKSTAGDTVIGFSLLEQVTIMSSDVLDCGNMFKSCAMLQSVPVMDVHKSTKFNGMFQGCVALLDIPSFDVGLGTDFSGMFQDCWVLKRVPSLNTGNGHDFSYMFSGCSALEVPPLMDTGNATNMSYMFNACNIMKSIPLLNTADVTDMRYMFLGCTGLETIPLLNTSKVTDFSYMFQGCSSLESIPAINMSGMTTNPNGMFTGCVNLSKVSATGIKRSISFLNCKLSSTRINEIFTNLVKSSASITVRGNYGASGDSASIATSKGWTVIG